MTLLQFMEGLTDRQAADAVRTRIDWKYLLCLELGDQGFDHTVLSEFRARLLSHAAERRMFDAVLALAKRHGLVHGDGRQRSDSTHVLAKIQILSRFELVAEALRVALDVLAENAPEWLRAQITPAWVDRYGLRGHGFGLPKTAADRLTWIAEIGTDGMQLLIALNARDAPEGLRHLHALETLRQVWVQNFMVEPLGDEEKVIWRAKNEIPPSNKYIRSPHDTDARYCNKGSVQWTGYKLHLTETCDSELPNLITNVETTAATVYDAAVLPAIHTGLQNRGLLPATHVADATYVNSDIYQRSRADYGVQLVGPTRNDNLWQAKESHGFAASDFLIDYANKRAVCPAGKVGRNWTLRKTEFDKPVIMVRWLRSDCGQCAMHEKCTKSMPPQRRITIRPHAQYEALKEMRAHEQLADYAVEYARQAGIEGTISEAVNVHAVRRARYIGQAKTHLAHLMTAAAINIARLLRWLAGKPKAAATHSAFQRVMEVYT